MTLAAQALQGNAVKVLDLALQYGYDSTDSFSRAFYKQHGVLPSQARKPGVVFISYPKLTFHISIKGAMEMDLIGLTANIGAETFQYYIAVISEKDAGAFAALTVPAATWAVFTAEGEMPQASQGLWTRILGEWLPSSAYELTDLPEYETYHDNGCEIFIPVKRK